MQAGQQQLGDGGEPVVRVGQDADDHRKIVAVLERHKLAAEPRICSFASVRHRHHGRSHFIDMHLRVPATLSIVESHDIASRIEREVLEATGEGTATAHMEPCGDSGCLRCHPPAS